IIELFPTGGGGYLVASKLLSPTAGTVSGCALVVDYVLTIIVSIAGGADALFSFLPTEWQAHKFQTEIIVLGVLIVLNLRGVKESVLPLVPVLDRKSTRLNSSHDQISYAVFCLKKKKKK